MLFKIHSPPGTDSRCYVALSGYPNFPDLSKSYPDFSRILPVFDRNFSRNFLLNSL